MSTEDHEFMRSPFPWPKPRRSIAARIVKRVERPAAYALLIGAAVTFVGVVSGFIVAGEAKWATLLIAADLLVSGASAVQDAET